MARVTWRLLPFLLLLYIISWLDRVNVGFAKLQMSGDLGLSETVYGFGAGIFFIGYGLCEVPSNLLLVRYGARIWIARIMITWGLISAAMMFVRGPNSFYVLRFLLGVAEAGFLPGIIYYLSQWFPREQRAKAVSWFMIGIPLSVVFGGPLSGWLLGFEGHLGLHGWQWMYLAEGLPAMILGFVVLGFLTDKPADAHWLTSEQRNMARRTDRERKSRGGDPARAGTRRGAHASDCVAARADHVLLPDRQLRTHALGADHREGPLGLHQPRGRVLLGDSVYRGGARHGAGRPQLRSHGERFLHIAIPSVIGAAGFVATGLISAPLAAIGCVVRGGSRRLLRRADRSGRCRASFCRAARPRARSR